MSVSSIRARFECDKCGSSFEIDLDESYSPPEGWSLFDVAEDNLRGGPLLFSVSEYGEHMCDACTKKSDAEDD